MENAYKNLKYFKKEMILGPLFKMLEVAFEIATPFLMAFVIDEGINDAIDKGDYLGIIIPSIMIFAFIILGFCSTLVCQYFASIASQGYGTKLRDELYKKIMGLSSKNINKLGKSNLNTVITSDVNRLQVSVAMMVRLVLRAPALVIGSLICSFIIKWQIGLIFLGVVSLIGLFLLFIIVVSSKRIKIAQEKTDELVGFTSESLNGIRVIKAFNKTKEIDYKFSEKSNDYLKEMKKVNFLNSLTNPVTFLIINAAILLIIYLGSKWINPNVNELSTGDLTSLIQYLNQIFLALVVVTNLIVIFTRAFASKSRVEKVLNTQSELTDGSKEEIEKSEDLEKIIEFRKVFYGYHKNSYALKDINLTINKGEKVGIIGVTGSGKSTLIKLINRTYDASEGEVILYGTNVKDLTLNCVRNEVSMVSQKNALLDGTIKSNLLIGKKDATEEEINKALLMACAQEFISKYDDGIDHKVSEGGKNLSGGQKQRVCIARGLIKNSDILVFDDSFSALDNMTERKVLTNICLDNDKTVIIVAQKITTLRFCNRIILIDNGCIIADGSHEELMKHDIYKEIFNSQNEE